MRDTSVGLSVGGHDLMYGMYLVRKVVSKML